MTDVIDRRLPIYLLLDCSESMIGEGIDEVNKGVEFLACDLKGDPHALETAWISVITFSSTAQQTVPLTELVKFTPPPLQVTRPGTALGAALGLLHNRIRQEVRISSPKQKGDWRPVVFLLTDGSPTDRWEEAAAQVRGSGANVVAIGCGLDADASVLQKISNQVLILSACSGGDFRKTLEWASASVRMSIPKICGQEGAELAFAQLPERSVLNPAPVANRGQGGNVSPREIFLAIWCKQRKKPYLMRYQQQVAGPVGKALYKPVRTHLIDEDYFADGGAGSMSSLASEQILGVLKCPRCGALQCFHCSNCGALFCCPSDENGDLPCPRCNAMLHDSNGGFQVPVREG